MSTTLILSSFVAGILTILAPCVLPLLPVIIGSSAISKDFKKPFIVTISLGISIVIFSLILKASTLFIGIPHSFWSVVSGGIVFVFGIFLLIPNLWYQISMKLKFDESSHKLLESASCRESIFGSVMIGAALGPVFSSCSPTYFVILATILPANFTMGLFYLVIYSLGLMFMLGLIGYFGQKIVTKMKWAVNPNGIFKKSMGALLIVTGLLVMTDYIKHIEAKILDTGYDASIIEHKLLDNFPNSNKVMTKENHTLEQYQKYTQEAVRNVQKNNNHYAFFFHADWCSTCVTAEKNILANIQMLPAKSVIFKVNFDTENQTKKDLNVLTQTTFIFFDPRGNVVDRKINPNMERIVQSLSGNAKQTAKPINNPAIVSSMQEIKNKKETFASSKEYFEFLTKNPSLKQATFAGGCFWCIEGPFEAENGVVEAFSGYAGGQIKNPSYEQVSNGQTGAREAITVFYSPEIISYQSLLEIYWRQIDPTDAGGQFADRGPHYTTAIFHHDNSQKQDAEKSKQELENAGKFSKIATVIVPFTSFYLAEEYHQDYYKKSADHYKRYKIGSGREANIKKNSKTFDKIFNDASKFSYNKPDSQKIKSMLSEESYAVTQEGATERPFANKYWNHKEQGIYVDIVTGEPLFSSTDKFDSGTGWPSFTKPIDDHFITKKSDRKLAVERTEVKSKMGNSHLGHVFNDGPKDKGGTRYCINSAALRFVPLDKMKEEGYEKYLSLFNK